MSDEVFPSKDGKYEPLTEDIFKEIPAGIYKLLEGGGYNNTDISDSGIVLQNKTLYKIFHVTNLRIRLNKHTRGDVEQIESLKKKLDSTVIKEATNEDLTIIGQQNSNTKLYKIEWRNPITQVNTYYQKVTKFEIRYLVRGPKGFKGYEYEQQGQVIAKEFGLASNVTEYNNHSPKNRRIMWILFSDLQ